MRRRDERAKGALGIYPRVERGVLQIMGTGILESNIFRDLLRGFPTNCAVVRWVK